MSTAFFKIVSAVIDALKASPAVCSRIDRARTTEVPEQDTEAVSVQWSQALPAQGAINGAPIDWRSRITVECFARSIRDSGDVAVDPLLGRVYDRLADDPTLGGLIGDLMIAGIEAENSAEGKKTGWVCLTYIADHRTSNSTLSE